MVGNAHTVLYSKLALKPTPVCKSLLTSGFYYALQNDYDLKLLRLHGPLGEVIEGALGVNHMTDRQRRDEKELVGPGTETHVQLQLIQRKKLALGRLARLRERTEKRQG